jgi:H+/gluconate symporter-like permease
MEMIRLLRKFGKEVLLFCGLGALGGAAIGFTLFLHLGPLKTAEDAGYATGLFIKSGVEVGLIGWVISMMIRGIRNWIFGSSKKLPGEKIRSMPQR